jgi:aldehyde:ferredoxin oxidoreductase
MPTLNYRLGAFEQTGKVDAIAVRDQMRVEMKACYACSVRCKKVVHIEEKEERARELSESLYKGKAKVAFDPQGRYSVDPKYGGPEYESLAALGVNLGLDDLIAICKSNEMCNYLAMDTVSLGATLAWAMECFERGLLTLEDTGGVPLRFHDADGVVKLVEMIAYRRGIGELLAEGSLRAARRLGRGSEAYLTTVKGMEMAMHDPRHMPVMRASYLLAPTGGDHMRQTSNRNGHRNQIGLCHFLAYDDQQSLDIVNAVTGWEMSPAEMVTQAHRGLTLARLFNLREGFTRADDALPRRFAEALPKHPGSPASSLDKIVTEYYVEQGWDPRPGCRPPTPSASWSWRNTPPAPAEGQRASQNYPARPRGAPLCRGAGPFRSAWRARSARRKSRRAAARIGRGSTSECHRSRPRMSARRSPSAVTWKCRKGWRRA